MLMPHDVATKHDRYMERFRKTQVATVLGHERKSILVQHCDGSPIRITLKVSEVVEDAFFAAVFHDARSDDDLHRCHALIEKMLPIDVIEQLLPDRQSVVRGRSVIASTHVGTVGFIDLVDFTSKTASMRSQSVARMLADIFREFDAALKSFHCENIKTIGDCYMFVTERTSQITAHAVQAVLFALRCVEIMRRRVSRGLKPSWEVRVGIATGKITSGVVPSGRIAFDAWGAIVNLASRLESLAPSNGVLVCAKTREYAAYHDTLCFEPLPDCKAKGFGEVEAYVAMPLRGRGRGRVRARSIPLSDDVSATTQPLQRLNLSSPRCLRRSSTGFGCGEADVKKRTCLILDEANNCREMASLQAELCNMGLEVVSKTYDEAKTEDLLHDPRRFDVILLRMRKPVLLGLEAAQIIRDNERMNRPDDNASTPPPPPPQPLQPPQSSSSSSSSSSSQISSSPPLSSSSSSASSLETPSPPPRNGAPARVRRIYCYDKEEDYCSSQDDDDDDKSGNRIPMAALVPTATDAMPQSEMSQRSNAVGISYCVALPLHMDTFVQWMQEAWIKAQ